MEPLAVIMMARQLQGQRVIIAQIQMKYLSSIDPVRNHVADR